MPQEKQSSKNPFPAGSTPSPPDASAAATADNRRWWIRLWIQPLLLLCVGLLLIVCLGLAQRFGLITTGDGSSGSAASGGATSQYICPMMCTPPQSEEGRCPVCAMELVAATSSSGGDSHSVQISPAARRIANIQTADVELLPVTRTISAIGELSYDEGTLKTLSAYVDGRLDRLYADYTGVVVEAGDQLALVYSPRLYSGQVELLLAMKAHQNTPPTQLSRVQLSNQDLFESARQRLIELGMTEQQIENLQASGEPSNRIHLHAPISGTVIKKFAVEGQYVKEGEPIYQLADLSTVWLMLELFPEDAAAIRYGQRVEANVQSLPGETFVGRVAFVSPSVDPTTRTVGVRVVIPNSDGRLRIGDYSRATIDIPLNQIGSQQGPVFDPELANKWISPRHPHVISDDPGPCPICGMELVPATDFGYVDAAADNRGALVVPRDAILTTGRDSVIYVETEPGRFEIRRVVVGPNARDKTVILSGLEEGDKVAIRGNFLIDSQMQLAGNPSLIDPTRAVPEEAPEDTEAIAAAMSELSEEDRILAERQEICPVANMRLGSMGAPKRVLVNDTPVFICCEGCRKRLLNEPDKYLTMLEEYQSGSTSENSLPANSEEDSWLPPILPLEAIESEDPVSTDGLPPILSPQLIEPEESTP